MEERKFIRLKKEEFGIKEYIKRSLGKGKISKLDIEYTPIGEKIIVFTSKPGLVIGRRGEKIEELTQVLKNRFKLENPHIEISEIRNPLFDSQLVADEIALALERMGNLKFKVIAYRKLQEIIRAGALGCELRLTGKLPSERARSWRFAEGYLKKAGESRKEIDRAQSTALTKTGIIGIKVAIMSPDARIYDQIKIDDELRAKIRSPVIEDKEEEIKKKIKKAAKKEIKEESAEQIKEIIKKPEKDYEEGNAIKIEQELEEGTPEEIIEEDLKKDKGNRKEEKNI
jgi:small subunit ribosomal protein S3